MLFRKGDGKFAITLDDSVICWYGKGCADLQICDNCDKKKDSKSKIYNYEFQGDQKLFKGEDENTILAGDSSFLVTELEFFKV